MQSQPWRDEDDDPTQAPAAPAWRDEDDAPDDIDAALPTVEREPATVAEPAPVAPEQALERQNLTLVQQAQALQVTDAATFAQAGELLSVLAEAEKRVHDFMDEDVARAHAAWKGLTEKRRAMLEPIETARRQLGQRFAAFDKAEKERAERERREREAAAQEEERRRLEAEAAELRAQAAEAADPRQADRLAQEAAEVAQEAAMVQAPVLPVQRTVAPVKGISSRSNWTCEVADKMALIRAVAAGEISPEALEPNMVYLRARAKADKAGFTCPGVRVYDAATVAVRTR